MKHIVDLLCDALVERLTFDLVQSIPEGDPTRATLVKKGRFQDDPCAGSRERTKAERKGSTLGRAHFTRLAELDPEQRK